MDNLPFFHESELFSCMMKNNGDMQSSSKVLMQTGIEYYELDVAIYFVDLFEFSTSRGIRGRKRGVECDRGKIYKFLGR